MKNLLILAAFLVSIFTVEANTDPSYAVVDGQAYYGTDLKIVFNKVNLKTENGYTLSLPLKKVDTYSTDGRVFDRIPVAYDKKGNVAKTEFCELIAYKDGLKLYRQRVNSDAIGTKFVDNKGIIAKYMVFEDNKLYLNLDDKNVFTVAPFFGIKVAEDMEMIES